MICRIPGLRSVPLFAASLLPAALSFCLRPSCAQTVPPLAAADPIAAQILTRTASTGMVMVLVRDSEVWIGSYGETAPHSRQKPSPDSILRLCSLTKIMTTDLLVKLAALHPDTVALTTPLQALAPPNGRVTNRVYRIPANTRPITLGDLATHTAGLPREIAYPANGAAHFTFPDLAFRWQWLAGAELRTVPGTAAHYSNAGFDFLADALSRAAAQPYPQLFASLTARPLGLTDTTLTPTPEQCARLLLGSKGEGPCTDTTATAGSSGMYSTANDMVRWLKYLLGLPGVPVHANPYDLATYLHPEDLRSIQGLSHAGIPTGLGLGWVHINPPGSPQEIIQKTGGGAGFNTYIALNPSHHLGLFVAVTEGRRSAANLFRESNDLLIQLAGLPPIPEDPNDPEAEHAPKLTPKETPHRKPMPSKARTARSPKRVPK